MSLRILNAPKEQFGYLKARTGCALTDDFKALMAVNDDNRIVGMVGYCDWTKNSVKMHMAVDYPLVWRRMGPALEYPFLQLGLSILRGEVRASEERAIRFAHSVGFRVVFRLKDGWAQGEDLLFQELRKEEWLAHLPLSRRARLKIAGRGRVA